MDYQTQIDKLTELTKVQSEGLLELTRALEMAAHNLIAMQFEIDSLIEYLGIEVEPSVIVAVGLGVEVLEDEIFPFMSFTTPIPAFAALMKLPLMRL